MKNMTVRELLPTIGIIESVIDEVIGNLEMSVSRGYDIKSRGIRTDNKVQVVTVSPNVKWTDGTCRPAYGGREYEVTIYLNKLTDVNLRRVFDLQ